MELRPHPRVVVERAEPDRDFVSGRPLAAEEARAAHRAEGLHATVVGTKRPNQLLAGEQAKSLAWDSSLYAAGGAGMLAAPGAMTVIGPQKRRRDLEANSAAQA